MFLPTESISANTQTAVLSTRNSTDSQESLDPSWRSFCRAIPGWCSSKSIKQQLQLSTRSRDKSYAAPYHFGFLYLKRSSRSRELPYLIDRSSISSVLSRHFFSSSLFVASLFLSHLGRRLRILSLHSHRAIFRDKKKKGQHGVRHGGNKSSATVRKCHTLRSSNRIDKTSCTSQTSKH